MNVQKIKSTKSDFHEGCGPSEEITLGFQIDNDHSYIIGRYYFGPGMNSVTGELFDKAEDFIDFVVNSIEKSNKAIEPTDTTGGS